MLDEFFEIFDFVYDFGLVPSAAVPPLLFTCFWLRRLSAGLSLSELVFAVLRRWQIWWVSCLHSLFPQLKAKSFESISGFGSK